MNAYKERLLAQVSYDIYTPLKGIVSALIEEELKKLRDVESSFFT